MFLTWYSRSRSFLILRRTGKNNLPVWGEIWSVCFALCILKVYFLAVVWEGRGGGDGAPGGGGSPLLSPSLATGTPWGHFENSELIERKQTEKPCFTV